MVGDRGLLTLGVDLSETRLEAALADVSGNVLASQLCLAHSENGSDRVIVGSVVCIDDCVDEAGRYTWKRTKSWG